MTHFDAMIRQKVLLKREFLNNQKIVNLLCNTGDNVEEFTDFKIGSKSPAEKLIRNHFYVPGTQQEARNFISMRSRVVYADNNVVKETQVEIFVICNERQMNLLQGSRADLIADEIDHVVNNGDHPLFGLGGIKIGIADEMQFNEYYYGWRIPYVTHEFNREASIRD